MILLASAAMGAFRTARAQEAELAEECQRRAGLVAASDETRRYCNLVAQAVETAQPQLGLALSGGNPVPGTASTAGMRLGALPRLSFSLRATGVLVELPDIRQRRRRGEITFVLPGLHLDGSVGLLAGFSPAPTVGGVGSLDALLSLGVVPLPEGEGFQDEAPVTWGAGLRLGIVRESFTLPGVSVSAMYRRLGDLTLGDPELREKDSFFTTDLTALSLRGAVGKRLFLLGLTAGVGYDLVKSDLLFGVDNPGGAGRMAVRFDGFENDRISAFLDVSWTMLVLHVVGELGWQSGGDQVPGGFPAGAEVDAGAGSVFGSLALRLSI